MNKAELAQTLADKVGITRKEAEDVVGAFVQVVTQTLQAGGEVKSEEKKEMEEIKEVS